MKIGFIEIGRREPCANCGRMTTTWVSMGNAVAPTCDQCKREVEQMMRKTKGFNADGYNYGPPNSDDS